MASKTLPKIIYGTAWKKERTTALVIAAVLNGFRAIDTGTQLSSEALVGEALDLLAKQHGIVRDSLWLQTKFTPLGGQDRTKPLPYDPKLPIPERIAQSLATSLSNLRTTYLDSYLLHSPLGNLKDTVEAWRTLIKFKSDGTVKNIGISNIYDLEMLQAIEDATGVRVDVVQNRWFEGNMWDRDVCKWCRENGVMYQSFWTLTGSPTTLLGNPALLSLADRLSATSAQAVFRIAQLSGITPLSGTTDDTHMRDDVAAEKLEMDDAVKSDEYSEISEMLFSS
ncbi:Aldo/keto reductase [Punctularia strigosozonata HHB-11173 SS5]|uniref:Aldo/keto reductase n=1 Tax=Punctularia strigosozonata (strain HHB-11173) TaxID=741275 RepID=UPI0004417F7F|nr:Aldo/keto reductase [Punctularia strigosozonata HHB-11173 SS5]EIN12061.1 Aldo/keto reductase [Punctularia strigosozonata HHB-11173 SS5]